VAAVYWAAEYSLIRVLEAEEQLPDELPEGADRPLDIVVLHTSDTSTLRALKRAASLAAELSARVHLLAPRIVPYPLALETPQVPVSFTARKLQELASEADVDVSVEIILCRDLMTTLSIILKPQSLIVMGGRPSRWWSFGWLEHEYRLAQRLRKQGHQVLSAELN
jgi:hypothetical protein